MKLSGEIFPDSFTSFYRFQTFSFETKAVQKQKKLIGNGFLNQIYFPIILFESPVFMS